MLKFYLTFFLDLSGIYSEFLSGTLSGIYFGIYSGVLSGRIWVFWHVPSLISRGALGPSIPQWRLAERGTLPALPDLFQHRRRSSGWLGVRPAKRGKLGEQRWNITSQFPPTPRLWFTIIYLYFVGASQVIRKMKLFPTVYILIIFKWHDLSKWKWLP